MRADHLGEQCGHGSCYPLIRAMGAALREHERRFHGEVSARYVPDPHFERFLMDRAIEMQENGCDLWTIADTLHVSPSDLHHALEILHRKRLTD